MTPENTRESWATLLMPVVLILGLFLLLHLEVGADSSFEAMVTPLEPWINLLAGYFAAAAEIAAGLVIGTTVLRAMVGHVRGFFPGSDHAVDDAAPVRLQMGRGLVLGLEFTIASDILRTAVSRTRFDIVTLGALVLLRTLLTHFLEREIEQGQEGHAVSLKCA